MCWFYLTGLKSMRYYQNIQFVIEFLFAHHLFAHQFSIVYATGYSHIYVDIRPLIPCSLKTNRSIHGDRFCTILLLDTDYNFKTRS